MCGICGLSVIPMRAEPSDRSEMVSQLLFGETWTAVAEERGWIRIRAHADGYEGWIDRRQALRDPEPSDGPVAYSLDLVQSATSKDRHIPLLIGSSLRDFDGMSFSLLGEPFVFNGRAVDAGNGAFDPGGGPGQLTRVALKYLGAPYLWGGRSPFGIDCSGFTQVVFRILGLALPRDSAQQAGEGILVDFAHTAREGDLAFFDDDEGAIVHVGIALGEGRIIHASGRVRIDRLDHQGIYNADSGRYSHKLRIIKRLLPG